MGGEKRRRVERPSIHSRNKYSENLPDFALLASLYPSFKHFVFSNLAGRPTIDWSYFNASRELTRALLLHDHGLIWWIPDGQLCPAVLNRSNYIHWIDDLLSSDIIRKTTIDGDNVKDFDVGMEQIGFTHFLVHLFWDGALLGQGGSGSKPKNCMWWDPRRDGFSANSWDTLVKGMLKDQESPGSDVFSSIFQQLEEVIKDKFCREKAS